MVFAWIVAFWYRVNLNYQLKRVATFSEFEKDGILYTRQ